MTTYQNTCIGDYSIIRALAPAPSIDGHVLLARDSFGAERAIKIGAIGTDDKILEEAQALAKLAHPSITTLCAIGSHDGRPYLILSPACPRTLEDKIKTKPLHAQDTRTLANAVLNALAYAHEQGVIHQDLAPRHILMTKNGHPVLCDFGNSTNPKIESSLASAKRLGSIPYMNVDQLSGKPPTAKMDLYATGMILAYAHQGKLWDLQTPPSENAFLSTFIGKLVSPNGYQTARDALDALEEERARDPKRDSLEQENTYLRKDLIKARHLLDGKNKLPKIALIASAAAGFAIGTALSEQFLLWLTQ